VTASRTNLTDDQQGPASEWHDRTGRAQRGFIIREVAARDGLGADGDRLLPGQGPPSSATNDAAPVRPSAARPAGPIEDGV